MLKVISRTFQKRKNENQNFNRNLVKMCVCIGHCYMNVTNGILLRQENWAEIKVTCDYFYTLEIIKEHFQYSLHDNLSWKVNLHNFRFIYFHQAKITGYHIWKHPIYLVIIQNPENLLLYSLFKSSIKWFSWEWINFEWLYRYKKQFVPCGYFRYLYLRIQCSFFF